MLRITELDGDDGVAVLRVEGRLTHHSLEDLMTSSTACLGAHSRVRLDLSGVRFVDADGAQAIRRLTGLGAELTGCSPFLTEVLDGHGAADRGADHGDDVAGETALLEALRRGDDAAFDRLVRAYGGRMLATARRLLRSEDDARDAVQDALLSAFKAIRTFSGSAQLSTWLHRIVVNAALMKIRSRRRRPEGPIDDLLPHFDDHGGWTSGMATVETPSDLMDHRRTRELVRRCIDRLPETYRVVLLLRDIEDLDTDEAAERLEISPNAVKIRLHRARQALRSLLEQEGWAADARAPQ